MGAMSIENKRIARKYLNGKLTKKEAMEQAGVSLVTLYNWKKNADKIKVKRPRKKGKVEVKAKAKAKPQNVQYVYTNAGTKEAITKILAICLEELGV